MTLVSHLGLGPDLNLDSDLYLNSYHILCFNHYFVGYFGLGRDLDSDVDLNSYLALCFNHYFVSHLGLGPDLDLDSYCFDHHSVSHLGLGPHLNNNLTSYLDPYFYHFLCFGFYFVLASASTLNFSSNLVFSVSAVWTSLNLCTVYHISICLYFR